MLTNTASKKQFEESTKYLSFGSSTNSKRYSYDQEPVMIERGKGCRIWNSDGAEYIDLKNGLGPITVGYAIPEINRAITDQLEKGIVFSAPHPLEGRAAQVLTELIPCAEKLRFLKTGGEALAAAIKIARAYTNRDKILQCGYNGWLNVLSSGGSFSQNIDRRKALQGVPASVSQNHISLPWNDYKSWEQVFENFSSQIAAAVVAVDYNGFEDASVFLPWLRRKTQEHGILLIMDEIVMGFRVAWGGAHEYTGITPDMAVFAKGMSNGMPLSAYCGRADLIDLSSSLGISSTNGGETLSFASLLAVVDIYRRENGIARLYEIGNSLWSQVAVLIEKYHLGIELSGHPTAKWFNFSSKKLEHAFFSRMFSEGVNLHNPAYVSLSFTEKDIQDTVECFDRVSRSLREEGIR